MCNIRNSLNMMHLYLDLKAFHVYAWATKGMLGCVIAHSMFLWKWELRPEPFIYMLIIYMNSKRLWWFPALKHIWCFTSFHGKNTGKDGKRKYRLQSPYKLHTYERWTQLLCVCVSSLSSLRNSWRHLPLQ